MELFHNGRRLEQAERESPVDGDYIVFETTPGTGYDAVKFLRFMPNEHSRLAANYVAK